MTEFCTHASTSHLKHDLKIPSTTPLSTKNLIASLPNTGHYRNATHTLSMLEKQRINNSEPFQRKVIDSPKLFEKPNVPNDVMGYAARLRKTTGRFRPQTAYVKFSLTNYLASSGENNATATDGHLPSAVRPTTAFNPTRRVNRNGAISNERISFRVGGEDIPLLSDSPNRGRDLSPLRLTSDAVEQKAFEAAQAYKTVLPNRSWANATHDNLKNQFARHAQEETHPTKLSTLKSQRRQERTAELVTSKFETGYSRNRNCHQFW